MAYEGWLSEDKTRIELPVPLGTVLYGVSTDCCDICAFDDEKTAELRAAGLNIKCQLGADCHTRVCQPYEIVLGLDNLERVFKGWCESIFVTREKAIEVTKENTDRARALLVQHGVELKEDGYFNVKTE